MINPLLIYDRAVILEGQSIIALGFKAITLKSLGTVLTLVYLLDNTVESDFALVRRTFCIIFW
mgnify:CR=1 FL=1